jgi:hypothetical protein
MRVEPPFCVGTRLAALARRDAQIGMIWRCRTANRYECDTRSCRIARVARTHTHALLDIFHRSLMAAAMIASSTASLRYQGKPLCRLCVVGGGRAEVIVLCAAYQGDLPGLIGRRSWARPADMAVVSWGAREAHLAARGPHQLTMGTVVVNRSSDPSCMAAAGAVRTSPAQSRQD